MSEEYIPPRLSDWLPTTRKEMLLRGWEELDVVLVTGDAYVDHPSFGAAVVGRIIEAEGLRVGIIAQPNWRDDGHEFMKFGAPRLFFGVSSGNMDPMVNHYTAGKRRRSDDAYSPAGEAGLRPDYATSVYTKMLKKLYPDVPVVVGGIEASLRRVAHYDYWQDKLMPSILADSGADLLVYGMGELPLKQLLGFLAKGIPFSSLKTIPQTAFLLDKNAAIPKNKNWEDFSLHSFGDCLKDKKLFAQNSKIVEQESNKVAARRLLQETGDRLLVVNPPFPTMSEKEIDASFDLPYTRLPHPKYKSRGGIPAYEMIKHSVNIHRGCFGGCAFCTISAHQGKFITSRSERSVLKELGQIAQMPDFHGTVTDLGGPSANMYRMHGKDLSVCSKCAKPSCISPAVCLNLDTSSLSDLMELYKKAMQVKGIKHVFIGSGIRYDMLLKEFNKNGDPVVMARYLEQVIKHHVSGRLKVAPEHTSDEVLKVMRKPSFSFFKVFKKRFDELNEKLGKKYQLIPYFISSHPGSTKKDMQNLAEETRSLDFKLEQVQDFTPTPMTVATDMYYSGIDPYSGKEVYCARSPEDKKAQNSFFFWYKSENTTRPRDSHRKGFGK